MNGAVGTALERPISASGPRRRTNGNPVARFVAAHDSRPNARMRRSDAAAHIGVVIAGHERDVVRARRALRARRAPARYSAGQREVDEIAGDRDVVGRLRLQIGDDARQHLRPMDRCGACAAS